MVIGRTDPKCRKWFKYDVVVFRPVALGYKRDERDEQTTEKQPTERRQATFPTFPTNDDESYQWTKRAGEKEDEPPIQFFPATLGTINPYP